MVKSNRDVDHRFENKEMLNNYPWFNYLPMLGLIFPLTSFRSKSSAQSILSKLLLTNPSVTYKTYKTKYRKRYSPIRAHNTHAMSSWGLTLEPKSEVQLVIFPVGYTWKSDLDVLVANAFLFISSYMDIR